MDSRRSLKNEESAQVGIGTMIVFIATVLVAAIAAGVLISTSADLQEKSSRTGAEATEQVASNLRVESVIGTVASSEVQTMSIFVSLAPGASSVDLGQLKIQMSDGASMATLDWIATTTGATADHFIAAQVRDADDSFDDGGDAPAVMTSGDLVEIIIEVDETALTATGFPVRTDVDISLIPEVGSSVPIGFTTPNSFGGKTIVELV